MKAEGYLAKTHLASFLQYVGSERKSCKLEVIDEDHGNGVLYLHDGELVGAETGELSGIEAAFEIVGWNESDVRILPSNGDHRTIDRPLTEILLAAAQDRDERGAARHRGERAAGEQSSSEQSTVETSTARPDKPNQARTRGTEPVTAGSTEGRRKNVITLQQVVDQFRDEVPEFVSTDIVNTESGLSIGGGTADPDFDSSVASACYAEVVKSNSRALELLGLGGGSAEDILITTEKIYILIRMLGAEYCHVLAVTRRGNLGLARAIMKKHESALLESLGDLS